MKLNLISFVDFRYSFRAKQLLIEIEPFQKCVKIQNCLKVGQWNPFNPLSANPTKWPNTLKQFNSLSVFGHFVNLALKGLIWKSLLNVCSPQYSKVPNCPILSNLQILSITGVIKKNIWITFSLNIG